jgi:hypothetical protein
MLKLFLAPFGEFDLVWLEGVEVVFPLNARKANAQVYQIFFALSRLFSLRVVFLCWPP